MMRRLIRTDGTHVDFTQPVPASDFDRLIGCAVSDSVVLWHMGETPLHVMIVDDLGYETEQIDHGGGRFEMRCVRARKPVNVEATKLYLANCMPGHTHQIVGDVLVVPDQDYTP